MIEKYVCRIIGFYFLLAWLVLTVVLFLQQGTRFTDFLFNENIGFKIVAEICFALLISITVFAAPAALVAGIMIGFGQLRGESELTAFFAAGVSRRRLTGAALLICLAVCCFSYLVNVYGIPLAGKLIRRSAVEAALIKLNSPIEPGVFNTEFQNFVVYVKDGNNEQGIWEKVFIYVPQVDSARIITAETGKIDQTVDRSELVLTNATVTTLPLQIENQQIAVEKVNNLRFTLNVNRQQQIGKLTQVEKSPDELSLDELNQRIQNGAGKEKLEAQLFYHRRLALSLAPFVLGLFAAVFSLRFARGGKGWASLAALTTVVAYYLLSLLGEQLAQTGLLPVFAGAWLPLLLLFGLSLGYSFKSPFRPKRIFWSSDLAFLKSGGRLFGGEKFGLRKTRLIGLLEWDLWRSIVVNFVFAATALLTLFLVFTAFEVLRGGFANSRGWRLVARYLLLLTPFAVLQLIPVALFIAVLFVYLIKAKRNELIVWQAAGQSVYSLLLPGLIFSMLLGALTWWTQEKVLPVTNPQQDRLRAQLRGSSGGGDTKKGYWFSTENSIVAFTPVGSDNVSAKTLIFLDFQNERSSLGNIIRSDSADWKNDGVELFGRVQKIVFEASSVELQYHERLLLPIAPDDNPFNRLQIKTADADRFVLKKQYEAAATVGEKNQLLTAIERRYAAIFVPLITLLLTAPLTLAARANSASSRMLVKALGCWLCFVLTMYGFERFGNQGLMPVELAVWSPLIIFGSLGIYFLAKIKS